MAKSTYTTQLNKCFRMLLFVSFGAETPSEIIDYNCARAAYNDLARTVKYRLSSSKSNKTFDEDKKNTIKNICEYIIDRIQQYPCDKNDYNAWHKETCTLIKLNMNNAVADGDHLLSTNFTIGQAQKWLNMTLKYLWLLDKCTTIDSNNLHAPIDSFIIEAVSKHVEDDDISHDNGTFKYRGYSWSQLDDYADYMDFQNIIARTGEPPIEWEYHKWIEIARERSSDV